MSNLGRYQELVTEAKSVDGVENYLAGPSVRPVYRRFN